MTLDQAAALMGASTRRLLAARREKCAAAVAHVRQGRRAPDFTLAGAKPAPQDAIVNYGLALTHSLRV